MMIYTRTLFYTFILHHYVDTTSPEISSSLEDMVIEGMIKEKDRYAHLYIYTHVLKFICVNVFMYMNTNKHKYLYIHQGIWYRDRGV
jgi:hypothetical protein